MKLALGTAQFGMNYGITNAQGQVPFDQVVHLLNLSQEKGVDLLDTAIAYGQSEEVLGQALSLLDTSSFRIISKCPKIDQETITAEVIDLLNEQVNASLRRLKKPAIECLLLHSSDDLLKPNADLLYRFLADLKSKKIVKKIGISVYDPHTTLAIVNKYNIDVVQLPFSVVDQRFLSSGCLEQLKQKNIEIHARSVFLQGVLFTSSSELPSFLKELAPKIELLEQVSQTQTLSKLFILLNFIRKSRFIDYVIVGVTSVGELKELLCAFQQVLNSQAELPIQWQDFAEYNEKLILPLHWKAV